MFDIANYKDNLFVGTMAAGIFLTTDNGKNWVQENSGLPYDDIEAIVINNTRIFAGAKYDGLYVRSLSEMVSMEQDTSENITMDYYLAQNYPNPFNPSTTISYVIPKQEMVQLKIFDITGREIIELINEVEEQGKHEISFEASKQPSGIYYYRIKAGNFVLTKKMILIK